MILHLFRERAASLTQMLSAVRPIVLASVFLSLNSHTMAQFTLYDFMDNEKFRLIYRIQDPAQRIYGSLVGVSAAKFLTDPTPYVRRERV